MISGATIVDQTILEYKFGTSNKRYQVTVFQDEDGLYHLEAEWGAIGKAQTTQEKPVNGVLGTPSLLQVKEDARSLILTKEAKGYSRV